MFDRAWRTSVTRIITCPRLLQTASSSGTLIKSACDAAAGVLEADRHLPAHTGRDPKLPLRPHRPKHRRLLAFLTKPPLLDLQWSIVSPSLYAVNTDRALLAFDTTMGQRVRTSRAALIGIQASNPTNSLNLGLLIKAEAKVVHEEVLRRRLLE
ncbi:hypothetical protein C8J57DRAFT_1718859 [Mycena rebaudengoi]|nr:hypothetical protein C8J57DRAFT_1718859 [Mycena rebaudengoi]